MKVTVYRPREAAGLGSPQGFLGEDRPTQGDWIQSAKTEQPDGVDPRMMLLQMARDFLIRSMYHVREPRFIGYAVENYGAACLALGHTLPLKDEQATWPHYEPTEVDPAPPEHHRWMLKQIGRVFGIDAAKAQAATLKIEWPRKVSPEQLAEVMKKEILEDVQKGIVPQDVSSFSQLHDFVDANCYGGTEALLDEMDSAVPDTDENHARALGALVDICNPAMDIVDAWIKTGAMREAAKNWSIRTRKEPEEGHAR